MNGLLTTLFGWPDGICTGNLIASAIWGAPALLHLHLHVKRHVRKGIADARQAGTQAEGRGPQEGLRP